MRVIRRIFTAVLALPLRVLLKVVGHPGVQTLVAALVRRARAVDHDWRAQEIKGRFQIHESVHWGPGTYFVGDGKISIGEGTYLGVNCFVVSGNDGEITIGRDCALSHNVHLRAATYDLSCDLPAARNKPLQSGRIRIGDRVWIGANVFVKQGVSIGDDAVVGANAVVTTDVGAGEIVGGIPAKRIGARNESVGS